MTKFCPLCFQPEGQCYAACTMIYHDEPDPVMVDDDIHIDVCQGYGRHYGLTQMMIDEWRRCFKPRDNEVMPQLCSYCLFAGY